MRIGRTRMRDLGAPDPFSRRLPWSLRTAKDSLHLHIPDAVRRGRAFLPTRRYLRRCRGLPASLGKSPN
eukprot:8648212-Heterocapsa_arctica.AAC.1